MILSRKTRKVQYKAYLVITGAIRSTFQEPLYRFEVFYCREVVSKTFFYLQN